MPVADERAFALVAAAEAFQPPAADECPSTGLQSLGSTGPRYATLSAPLALRRQGHGERARYSPDGCADACPAQTLSEPGNKHGRSGMRRPGEYSPRKDRAGFSAVRPRRRVRRSSLAPDWPPFRMEPGVSAIRPEWIAP